MHRRFSASVLNLLSAARSAGNDAMVLIQGPDFWKQTQFCHFHRNFIVFTFIAEGACHPAAAGRNQFNFQSRDGFQNSQGAACGIRGFLVAMSMDPDFFLGNFLKRKFELALLMFLEKELVQQLDMGGQSLGIRTGNE